MSQPSVDPAVFCSEKPMAVMSLHFRKCDLRLVVRLDLRLDVIIIKVQAGLRSIKEICICYVARFFCLEKNGVIN